jgi:hypothetical protein
MPEPTGGWVLVKAPAPRGRENSTLNHAPGRESPSPGLFYFGYHPTHDATLVKPASGAPAVGTGPDAGTFPPPKQRRPCWWAVGESDAQHARLGLMPHRGTARLRRASPVLTRCFSGIHLNPMRHSTNGRALTAPATWAMRITKPFAHGAGSPTWH